MNRHLQLQNRKGRLGGCRSRVHARVQARLEFRASYWMQTRDQRRYFGDLSSSLYGAASKTTRYFKYNRLYLGNPFRR